MRRLALASALALALLSAGCVELQPARVPDRLLEGAGGNGWSRDDGASQSAPESASFGMEKSQTLVYTAEHPSQGYPGSLTVTTLRSLLRPTESKVRDTIEGRIRDAAQARGLSVDTQASSGSRTLASGATSQWFVYNGSVQTTGSTFQTRDAHVKIYGEVFDCVDSKAIVAAIGLAQITDVRRVGGVPLQSQQDDSTWRAIVSDPVGAIEGIRGSDGLSYNIVC